jgi:pimeloyl-ACP methyl ester carboxylesterase
MLIEERVPVCKDPRVDLFTVRSTAPVERALLIIHGGPDWDHTYLLEPLVGLAETHLLVFADLRGCGRSTTGLPDEAYNPDAATTDLLTMLDVLGIGRVDVLGFSYGGMLAQRLTLAAPQRVSRLIIASSSIPPVPGNAYDDWPEAAEFQAAGHAAWTELLANPTPENTRAHALASIPANAWKPESREELHRRLETVRFSAEWARPFLAGTLPSARPDDSQARLTALDLPILLLHGRQDLAFPAALAERTAAEMPNAHAVVLDQAGHMTHIDQPRNWLQAITNFLG